MAGEERSYWELVEPVMGQVNIYEGSEAYSVSIANLPRPCVLLYAAHMCLAEVHNGGFLQLFWNNTGIVIPEAIEGFTALGMPKAGALLKRAATLLGESYPLEREDRWDALLGNSGLDQGQLQRIFESESNLYLAFVKATTAFSFEKLSEELLALANQENDGFQRSATRYAGLQAAVSPVQ